MKIKHMLFFALTGALGGCSTAYRSAQTPDDVYYSPAPEQSSYVSNVSDQDKNSYSYRNEETDIRRGIEDPVYRNSITFSMGMGYGYSPYSLFPYNSFNNPFYGYDPYGYSPYGYNPYGYSPYGLKGMYDPYNSFSYNDLGFYSPYGYNYSPYYNYYSPGFYSAGNLRVNTNTGARKYNLNGYNNTITRTSQPRGNAQPIRTETTAPVRNTGVGSVIRRVFTPTERRSYSTPNNNTRTYNNNNTRTYNNDRSNTNETRSFDRTPSVSTPSSSSGSSSSAPVRTFRR